MKIIADTNLLVRAAVGDDPVQGPLALQTLSEAEGVALPLPALCEFAWVLRSYYRTSREGTAAALRAAVQPETVETDREAVEAGLAMLDAGGDFADGVIAAQGRRLGGEVFVSFDRDAVKRLTALGHSARVP